MRGIHVGFILAVLAVLAFASSVSAHPMGNFSINHYSRIYASTATLSVHTALDYAEIPTLQLLSDWGLPTDKAANPSELQFPVTALVRQLSPHLRLRINGTPVSLAVSEIRHQTMPGAGGLQTLRVSFVLTTPWKPANARVEFFDDTYNERIGWKEIVVGADGSLGFPDGNAFETDRSAELTNYPSDLLSSPPNISSVSFVVSPGAERISASKTSSQVPVVTGKASFLSGNVVRGDRLSEILSQRELPLQMVLLALGISFILGGLHAMSPGHGKTVVAAYLVGNRGTARHAAFLGAIVTFTHTAGVFLLGIITLFASSYIVPEAFYPWMGLISGMTIVVIGANLLRTRLFRYQHSEHDHHHGPGGHTHEVAQEITFRSLVALGVSGGIVPCPSALVVLLSAIALHRLQFGLLLLVSFSAGLASVLVLIGLLVVRAGKLFRRAAAASRLANVLPTISAAIITIIGVGIAASSLASTQTIGDISLLLQTQALVVLGLGLLLGLKHATDADHIVAVTTFVSESKSFWRSCGIGVFWGIGHTLSLAIAGLFVIIFKIGIPAWLEARLEFAVAIMLVALGARVLIRVFRRKIELHGHEHDHSGLLHSHWHLHNGEPAHVHSSRTHIGLRPLLVGMVHGAAGSAALMLLVLSTIKSPLEAFVYILVFGFGSVLGMLLISCLLALSLHWVKGRVATSYMPIQLMAGLFSCLFGIYLGIEIWSSMP